MSRKNNINKKNLKQAIIVLIIAIIIAILAHFNPDITNYINELFDTTASDEIELSFDLDSIPEYDDKSYVIINNNIPSFTEDEYTTESFEKYSELDSLGRCGVAYANICKETMPPDGDERGNISKIKPTGWQQKQYNGEYLYNRCHLIGWQLSDEDDNKLNLITGTNYFNVTGMLPFENEVAEYVKKTEKHVLYRVTPIFEGDNALASGVQMEAYSVEDNGEGVCFNVYIYNVQPGIVIDYSTGESYQK